MSKLRLQAFTWSFPNFFTASFLCCPTRSPYDRSFNRQCLYTGRYSWCSSIRTRLAVRMLRRSKDVWTSSNRIPLRFSICPATRASSTPSSVRGVSVQPMNRLSLRSDKL
jgi:hypothetical protein